MELTYQHRYIFTLLGKKVTSTHLDAMMVFFKQHHLNCDKATQLTASDAHIHAHQFLISTDNSKLQFFQDECLKFSVSHDVDLTVQDANVALHKKRLVCFDMDSTLIAQEVIDELAKEAGVGEQVAQITEQAMQGHLDFQQSFRARVALLKGLNISVLDAIASRLNINEGAVRLIRNLNAKGIHTVILSGGFQYFALYLKEKLGLDEVHANYLDVVDNQVTGHVTGTIVDGERKAVLLQQIAKKLNLELEEVVAVGDGANDLAMLGLAGLGVAYHAKPLVRQKAKQAISNVGLDGVLYLLGFNDDELDHSK